MPIRTIWERTALPTSCPPRLGDARRALSLLAPLLPLTAVVAAMALGAPPHRLTDADRPGNIPTLDSYAQDLRGPRYAPLWRVNLRRQYDALAEHRITLSNPRDPENGIKLRRLYEQDATIYNAIARAAPPETFAERTLPHSVPLTP